MWLTILIIVIIAGAIYGSITSREGEKGEGALEGAFMAGMGCGYILFKIFLWGAGLLLLIWLFGFLFS